MYIHNFRTRARRVNVNINLFSFMQLRNLIVVLFIFFGGIFFVEFLLCMKIKCLVHVCF